MGLGPGFTRPEPEADPRLAGSEGGIKGLLLTDLYTALRDAEGVDEATGSISLRSLCEARWQFCDLWELPRSGLFAV